MSRWIPSAALFLAAAVAIPAGGSAGELPIVLETAELPVDNLASPQNYLGKALAGWGNRFVAASNEFTLCLDFRGPQLGLSTAILDGFEAVAFDGHRTLWSQATNQPTTTRSWEPWEAAPQPFFLDLPSAGSTIAYQNNFAVVGNPNTGFGQARIVHWVGIFDGWVDEWSQNGSAPMARLGSDVAIDGRRVVFGESHRDNSQPGKFYLRDRSSTGAWVDRQTVTSPSPQSDAGFGTSLAMSGSWLAVGAPFEDSATLGPNTGAVYLYRLNFFQLYQFMQRIEGPQSGSYFGFDVALQGDTLLVGAPKWDGSQEPPVNTDQGSAFAYWREGDLFQARSQLLASSGAEADWFGLSVALASGRALVGAAYHNRASVDVGSLYLYDRTVVAPLFADDFESGDSSAWSTTVP